MLKLSKYFHGISILIVPILLTCHGCGIGKNGSPTEFNKVLTIAGANGEFGEPFGTAEREGEIYFSDGERGEIRRLHKDGSINLFTANLDTPSQIVFDSDGNLIVADSGSHTIKRISDKGTVEVVAGVEGQSGFLDGDIKFALFNAPVGVAVAENKIYVADTYNDRIRVIENGNVSTLAGGSQSFADGVGVNAMFDTPLGIAVWNERILVADAGNRRIRIVEQDGRVWTLAGNGGDGLYDGLPMDASFTRPAAVTVGADGVIYIADGNTIRAIGRQILPFVETISNDRRGFRDGTPLISQFNRPSGLAVGEKGELIVADSDNGLIRKFESGERSKKEDPPSTPPKQFTAEEFKQLQPPRWPYDPPETKRDIAGTLGEIRGEIVDENSQVWFHNGLDIAGAYGETARLVRDEKVLNPMATENFNTSRELLRMPTLGYIHLRLGRDVKDKPFGDERFIFSNLTDGTLIGVRVPRGAKFRAGEAIGTLNAMNHVHLIAGRSGAEMNALDALILPNVSDSIAPIIEKVSLFDENWNETETEKAASRITLTGKTRIVVRAFDRMDGNPERRKLGVYKLGYQVFPANDTPAGEINWSITFQRNPPFEAAKTVYAKGSKSGATGETIFNYIVTNRLNPEGYGEGFLDTASLANGTYTVRVFAADFFSNQSFKDTQIEVKR